MQFELLSAYGIDWKSGLVRCMNDEELYARLLSLFLQDTSFPSAVEALRRNDYSAAFDYLHDLKGSSGNAGLTELYNAVSPLVDALRNGKHPKPETSAQLGVITTAYIKSCTGIRRFLTECDE